MSIQTQLTRRSSGHQTAVMTAALIGLFAIAPVVAIGDQHPAAALETRVAKVSLADLDLSTPEGIRAAHERLHATAGRLCTRLGDSRDLGYQPHFVACADATLANALQQLDALALAAVQRSRIARSTAR